MHGNSNIKFSVYDCFPLYFGTRHLHWCVPFVKNGLIILLYDTSYCMNSPLLGDDLFSQFVISINTESCTVNSTCHSRLHQWSDFSYCHVWNVLVVSCLMDGYRCRIRTYFYTWWVYALHGKVDVHKYRLNTISIHLSPLQFVQR